MAIWRIRCRLSARTFFLSPPIPVVYRRPASRVALRSFERAFSRIFSESESRAAVHVRASLRTARGISPPARARAYSVDLIGWRSYGCNTSRLSGRLDSRREFCDPVARLRDRVRRPLRFAGHFICLPCRRRIRSRNRCPVCLRWPTCCRNTLRAVFIHVIL